MIAVLHNIRSLHNVGSIFRTADAAGIKKLYLCGITPAPVDQFGRVRAALAKVALGGEESVSWESVESTAGLLDRMKGHGKLIVAVEQDDRSEPYDQLRLSSTDLGRTVLVVGNEVDGLDAETLSQADHIIEIPMRGKKESLNVSVAFGVVVFELIKVLG